MDPLALFWCFCTLSIAVWFFFIPLLLFMPDNDAALVALCLGCSLTIVVYHLIADKTI